MTTSNPVKSFGRLSAEHSLHPQSPHGAEDRSERARETRLIEQSAGSDGDEALLGDRVRIRELEEPSTPCR